jgi:hypothetical protein
MSIFADETTYEAVAVGTEETSARCEGAMIDHLNNQPNRTCSVKACDQHLSDNRYKPHQVRQAKSELLRTSVIRLINLGPYTERVYELCQSYNTVRGCNAMAGKTLGGRL